MPFLSPRQEAFCQAYVMTPVARQAATAAGYSRRSARNQGWRLLQRPEIVARIRDLRTRHAEAHTSHKADILAKAEALFTHAMEDRQFTAAWRALALQARLLGIDAAPPSAVALAAAKVEVVEAPGGGGRISTGMKECLEASTSVATLAPPETGSAMPKAIPDPVSDGVGAVVSGRRK